MATKQESIKQESSKKSKNSEFVEMTNPKGTVREIHKDRVAELEKQGYTPVKGGKKEE